MFYGNGYAAIDAACKKVLRTVADRIGGEFWAMHGGRVTKVETRKEIVSGISFNRLYRCDEGTRFAEHARLYDDEKTARAAARLFIMLEIEGLQARLLRVQE